jgi:hypothetical protein
MCPRRADQFERKRWQAVSRAVLAVGSLFFGACAAGPDQLTSSQTAATGGDLQIRTAGRTFEDFVPEGWTLARTVSADLDADGRDGDGLLLLTRPASAGTPAQALAVVVREAPPGAGYVLAASNGRLIPRSEAPGQEDPMADGELVADTGSFEIRLTLLAGIGSYETARLIFQFRHEPGCFRLIAFQRLETHRATLAMHDLSVDYVSGAVVDSTGNAASDAITEKREQLQTIPRHCFADLGPAEHFNPLEVPR